MAARGGHITEVLKVLLRYQRHGCVHSAHRLPARFPGSGRQTLQDDPTNAVDIHVLTTGGTIDKIYFDALSDFQVGAPQIEVYLREANVSFSWCLTPLMRKDSLELTAEDRAVILDAVRASQARRILITHGTDTMLTTAGRIAEDVGVVAGKTVVLTGAMCPATQRGSDAVFNIGFAIGALRLLPAGVYVAMNGQVFPPGQARKNRAANRFEAVLESTMTGMKEEPDNRG